MNPIYNQICKPGLLSIPLVLVLLFPFSPVHGEEGENLMSAETAIRYIELKPTFVTNFGVSDRGHMRYVKADVTVSVTSRDAEYAARYHLPAIRDKLVLLLARQDESTISSSMGRETIKAEALSELRDLLETEEGDGFIDDLMFTNFVVQR